MASLRRDPGGKMRVMVTVGGVRRPIRLGVVSVRIAEQFTEKTIKLEQALAMRVSAGPEVADWVGNLDPKFRKKLARVGLIEKPVEERQAEVAGLGAFIDGIIAARPNLKPNTRRNYLATRSALVEVFGESRDLRTITPGECDDWVLRQQTAGRGPATTGRNVKRAAILPRGRAQGHPPREPLAGREGRPAGQ